LGVEMVVLSVVVVCRTPRGHTDKGDEVEVGGDSFVGMRLCSAVEVDGSDAVVMVYCVRRVWRWR